MPRKATIYLYDGDDMERMADLRRAVDIAERQAETASLPMVVPRRLGDDEPESSATAQETAAQEARDAFDAFVDEAVERAEAWELHAIGFEEFRTLLKNHPPRKVSEMVDGEERETTDPEDVYMGPNGRFEINSETFPKALLLFVDPDDVEHRTVHAPFTDAEALRKRVRRLSAGEFESLWFAAYTLNEGGVADPLALRYSPDALR